MQKKEWVISLCMLCVLALAAAGISAYVIRRNQPDEVAAFENRFLDMTILGWQAPDGVELSVSARSLTAEWPSGNKTVEIRTGVMPLPEGCRDYQITLGAGGTPNGFQKDSWGFQAWLELRLMNGEETVSVQRTEMPLLAERDDRTRIYTVRAKAEEADGWQLCVRITPVDGTASEGTITLKNWEVHAR